MDLKTQFIGGMLLGATLFGCAGATFSYKYYALDADNYNGFMRGPKPVDDLPLSICMPTMQDKAPCVVLKTSDLIKLKTDYKDMQNRLQKCGG